MVTKEEFQFAVVKQLPAIWHNTSDVPLDLAVQVYAESVAPMQHALRTRPDYDFRCQDCGAPHNLDTSIHSPTWNAICENRPGVLPGAAGIGMPEVGALCTLCIDDRLVKAGLTAEAEFYYVGTALRGRQYAESEAAARAAYEAEIATLKAAAENQAVWQDQREREFRADVFALKAAHEARVTELLAANGLECERRREAFRMVDRALGDATALRAWYCEEHQRQLIENESLSCLQCDHEREINGTLRLMSEARAEVARLKGWLEEANTQHVESQAEVERLKFQRDAAIEYNGSVYGELERAKKWTADALDEVERLTRERDAFALVAKTEADFRREDAGRLGAENERLKGEREADRQAYVGRLNEFYDERGQLLERLALADKLADAVQKYSRTCYACTGDDTGAACTCTEASHDYNEMRLALDAYLASREGEKS